MVLPLVVVEGPCEERGTELGEYLAHAPIVSAAARARPVRSNVFINCGSRVAYQNSLDTRAPSMDGLAHGPVAAQEFVSPGETHSDRDLPLTGLVGRQSRDAGIIDTADHRLASPQE